jgi:hypothetical protein
MPAFTLVNYPNGTDFSCVFHGRILRFGLVIERKPTKTWERTRLQNLVRHKSGRYYARAFARGKEVWKSLTTSHFSVAQARLAEFLKEHRQHARNGKDEVSDQNDLRRSG